jgi:hypothetical protein
MRFTIDLDISNAVFDAEYDNDKDAFEIAFILRALADKLDDFATIAAYDEGALRDFNGNTIGSWSVTP